MILHIRRIMYGVCEGQLDTEGSSIVLSPSLILLLFFLFFLSFFLLLHAFPGRPGHLASDYRKLRITY